MGMDLHKILDTTEKALINRVDLCNKMIKYLAKALQEETFTSLSKDPTFSKWTLDFLIHHDAELLLAILDKKKTQLTRSNRSSVPVTSLASSSLFTGAKYEPSLEKFTSQGEGLRVITTSYYRGLSVTFRQILVLMYNYRRISFISDFDV